MAFEIERTLHEGTVAQQQRFGAMLQEAMVRLDISPQVLSYQCGIDSEDVSSILKGAHPLSLDLMVRATACLGMELTVSISPKRE